MAYNYGSQMSEGRNGDTPTGTTTPYSDTESLRQPLIDRAANNWQDQKASYAHQEAGYGENACSPCSAREAPCLLPKTRKMLGMLVLVLIPAIVLWRMIIRPHYVDEWEMKEGFLKQENGTYGIARGGHFDGVRMQTLDSALVPGGVEDPEGNRRLVFVGDIHGCASTLKELLQKIEFDEEVDHLIAVGDTISKGPENVQTLDELIRLGATSVRGNHEDRILALAPSVFDNSFSETSSEGARKDARLLQSLKKHHIKFLQRMPLMLRVPALPMADKPSHKDPSPIAEEIIVVHAGLVPAVTLEKQDPFFVMNMRSITTKKHLPQIEAATKKGKSKPWHDIWGWYNDRLFRKKSIKDFEICGNPLDDHTPWDPQLPCYTDYSSWLGMFGQASKGKWPEPQVVVYGHHAKAGLQVERWSKGLDTGCARGGKLTAMVLDARGRQEIVSVDCEDVRE